MHAIRVHRQLPAEQADLRVETRAIPNPGPGQVRLRIETCGVCHTDLHILEGDIHPPHLPVTPGHQVVGRIDAVGAGVEMKTDGWFGVPWLYSACGDCAACRRGAENLCEQARFTGFHTDGGFAEFMLAEADYVLPIPPGIDPLAAAPLLCAGIVGYRSLKLADIEPGDRVGLVGFGASAHLQIQVLRHWGCEVFVFTRSEEHRRHARALGAAWAGGAEADLGAIPGLADGLDRAVIFAPAGRLVPVMLAKLRPGGTLAINAVHMSPIPEMPYERIYMERTLRSVANATYQDGVEFLALAAEIPVRADTVEYALADAGQALLDLKHSRINGEAVLRAPFPL